MKHNCELCVNTFLHFSLCGYSETGGGQEKSGVENHGGYSSSDDTGVARGFLRSSGPLPLAQVLKLGVEIADALDKAYRSGIVHRDLKPGNIMLTKSGANLLLPPNLLNVLRLASSSLQAFIFNRYLLPPCAGSFLGRLFANVWAPVLHVRSRS